MWDNMCVNSIIYMFIRIAAQFTQKGSFFQCALTPRKVSGPFSLHINQSLDINLNHCSESYAITTLLIFVNSP